MKAIEFVVTASMAEAEAALRPALAEQGFGVLTEIDVAAILNAKLGIGREPLKILGVCNPSLAHQALELDPSVSLLLPCNVVLDPVGGGTRIRAVDPTALMDDPAFAALAAEASGRLEAALRALAAAVAPESATPHAVLGA